MMSKYTKIMTKDEIIVALRAEKMRQGLTDYELAKRADIAHSTLDRFNQPGWGQQIETLVKIATALGLDVTFSKRWNK